MLLKTGGGKFLKNSTATGGMIQKNDTAPPVVGNDAQGNTQQPALCLARLHGR
jgi:hypothetical protein